MNAVIYARFSSYGQTEQSIEGQVRVCKEYAERNKINIIGEYIDRALTGTNDNRPAFLQMIEDSKKKHFDRVLVYKLDRFSRSKYDNALYKHMLGLNGVKVISATEIISDTPEGVLVESLLEAFAELYSKDLSQKVKRGIRENFLKGLTIGGIPPFGYKVENKKMIIDEEKAQAVKIMFEDYADGYTKNEIAIKLNELGFRTRSGAKFNKNSINYNLTNKKYTGYYKNDYIESYDYYPKIIEETLFNKVQDRLKHNKIHGGKAKINYLLSGKLFCGHCGTSMIGTSGTSRTGETYAYYTCLERNKNHSCKKKNEKKQKIEDDIISFIKDKVLKKGNLDLIATSILKEYDKSLNTSKINEYKVKIKEIDKELDNITTQFIATKNQKVIDRLNKRADDLAELQDTYQEQINKITLATSIRHEKADIIDYLKTFIFKNEESEEDKQRIIDNFVNSVYVFDDYYNIYINIVDKQPLITFKEAQEDLKTAIYSGSCSKSTALPQDTVD